MRTAMILLAFIALAFLLSRLSRRARARLDVEPRAHWTLVRSLLAPLLGGVLMLVLTVRGLVRGEVPCGGKGGCTVGSFTRADHPEPYWVNLGFLALMTGLLLWFAWRGYQRWRSAGG